jgi:dTDP-4-dehydrorhamnose 3,5-epimerase
VIFHPTEIADVWVVEPERLADERGFFARIWDSELFAERGLRDVVVQASISFNRRRGTLRGLHYQAAPHEEAKLVRCTAGRVFDVAVDLRPGSGTFCRWTGVELSAESRKALYVPEGCAHGFLTLEDDCEIAYQMSTPYMAEAGRGVRFDDPAFAIVWPGDVTVINERDSSYPDFIAAEVAS